MAYDEALAARYRAELAAEAGVTEKRMMGGLCFFVNGNMLGGADRTKEGRGRFMFRVGKALEEAAQSLLAGEPMFQGGRRMTGLFFVDASVCGDELMREWLDLALRHARSLPPK